MYPLVLHKNLTPEKWSKFRKSQQILMIGNELNRAINLKNKKDISSCLERALELIDLTVECQKGNFRKELLRFREILGESYLNLKTDLEKLLDVLITLDGEAYSMLKNTH